MRKQSLFPSILALLLVLPVGAASAQSHQKSLKGVRAQAASGATVTIRVCNRSNDPALVAISYIKVGESRFINEGWFRVNAGACKDLAETGNAHFYAYADVVDKDRHWGGSHDLCVEYPGPYEFYTSASDTCRSGQETRGFVPMEATDTGTYTWNLDP